MLKLIRLLLFGFLGGFLALSLNIGVLDYRWLVIIIVCNILWGIGREEGRKC